MAETIYLNDQYVELGKELLFFRNNLTQDRLTRIFSEVTLFDFVVLEHLWPELIHEDVRPEREIYLQDMTDIFERDIHEISKLVQALRDNGLVRWEQGENGTYVRMSQSGYESFHSQQLAIRSYFKKVISKVGLERFREMMDIMEEMENILNET